MIKLKLSQNGEIKAEETQRGKLYIIKLKKGVITVTNPTLTRQYNGRYAQSSNIHIESKSFDALSKALDVSNHTYWHFEWIISDALNVQSLMKKISDLAGKSPGSSATTHANGHVTASADYAISNSPRSKIRVTLSDTGSSTISKIGLTCDSGMFDNGFKKAHKVFSPDLILSILFGELPLSKIRELAESI